MRRLRLVIATAIVAMVATTTGVGGAPDALLEAIRSGAAAMAPVVHTALAREFLDACTALPPPPARVLFQDLRGRWFSETEAGREPDSVRSQFARDSLDAAYFYQAQYGSILNYTPLFEVLGAHGVDTFAGRRILDFGYGRIGHLRALAGRGATAVGVDIDPRLRALYSAPGDQGDVRGAAGRTGRVTAITGWFPGDSTVRSAVGAGYDLVISKNTLKGGHSPEERARQRRVIDLGVSDSAFVAALAACVRPGGLLLLYTISGPRGNAGCPFPESMLRDAGFEIVAYDADDSPATRAMMSALHRGQEPGDVPDDALVALYTLARRVPARAR